VHAYRPGYKSARAEEEVIGMTHQAWQCPVSDQ
jgi:hypothetical protein